MTLAAALQACRAQVESALERRLPPRNEPPARLHDAMRYAVLGGGKRLRPALVYFTGRMLGASDRLLDPAACAVELIHAYSLIHDDLPAMDDDDLRRGRPTCHRAFDEATAILAGDALQALAFELLAGDAEGESNLPAVRRLEMVAALAAACGSHGMVGGQALDIDATGKALPLAELEGMHRLKTGALIRASVRLGALCGQADAPTLRRLDDYASAVGLAFQIRDDILDAEGDTATLGKTQGADEARGKSTYTTLLGLTEAKRLALAASDEAVDRLTPFGERAALLRELAHYITERIA